MIFFSSYSVWWKGYSFYFLLAAGMHLTWVNGIFNLCSTAGLKFDWRFVEPFIYLLVIFFEVNGDIDAEIAWTLYQSFTIWTCLRYMLFLYQVVSQLTKGLGIPFIVVKDKKSAKVH